jgi:hypothetical protein
MAPLKSRVRILPDSVESLKPGAEPNDLPGTNQANGIKEFITCNWTLWNLKSIQRIVKHFETQHSQMDGDSAMFMRLGFQMVRFQLKSWELLSLKHGFTTCQVGMGHKSKLMYQWNHQLGHPY